MPLLHLDTKDRKIIKELNANARQSYNSIAKKTQLSKNQIVYRTNRLMGLGIITKFCAIINHPKMGYHYYRYSYALEFFDDAAVEDIIAYIKTLKNIYWVATTEGRYNLVIESIQRKVLYAIDQYLDLAKRFSSHIRSKEIELVDYGHNLANNYIYTDFVSDINVLRELHEGEKAIRLDEHERQIINGIKDDARINAVKLAKRIGLSSKTVISKIRQLEKQNIIMKYRLVMDHNKFDLEQHHVLLNLQYSTGYKERQLCEHLCQHKEIIRITKPVGGHDLEFRCMVKNNYDLLTLIKKIRQQFPKFLRSYESILITKTYPINTIRF